MQIKYSIGIVHEYCTNVQLAFNYPEVVPEDPCMDTWPAIPPYHNPSQHVTQKFYQDMTTLSDTAFRGEVGQPVMKAIADWDVDPS